jgi:DNA replication protein DnaC
MEAWHPDVQPMADAFGSIAVRWFSNNVKAGPITLVVVGGTGCGKTLAMERTHAWAVTVAAEAWRAGGWGQRLPVARYLPWLPLYTDMSNDDGREAKESAMRAITGADFLLIDDIGTEIDRFKSGAPVAVLTEILDATKDKFRIITTNVPMAEWPRKWDKRVEDRLLRKSIVMQLNCGSYQKQLEFA